MPLSKDEREFLDAYVYEATHEPFAGPATTELRRRDLYYSDLHGILTAYHREATSDGASSFGKRIESPRPCPWADRDTAVRRSAALLTEYTGNENHSNGPGSPTSPEAARA